MPMMHHIVLAMKSFRDTVSPLLVNKRNASVLTSFSVARIDGREELKVRQHHVLSAFPCPQGPIYSALCSSIHKPVDMASRYHHIQQHPSY
jgi:hypothetical protein